MRKKILAFVFGAALLVAMAVPLFGSVGTASADRSASCPAVEAVHGALVDTGPPAPAHFALHDVSDAAGCL